LSSLERIKDYIDYYPDSQDIQKILAMYLRKPGNQKIVKFQD